MPFGRYVGTSEVSPPADEVLIGREGHRAYLIDLLIGSGRRGAYLVTGRRGAGKTSFVQHCIAEYEASVVSRYLRSNSGKGFWDRLFMLSFWPLVLIAGLLISQLLLVILANEPDTLLMWLVVGPTAVMLLYPCVYAKVVVEAVFDRPRAPDKEDEVGKGRSPPGRGLGKTFVSWLGTLLGGRAQALESGPADSEVPSVLAAFCVLLGGGVLFLFVLPWGPVQSAALFMPLVGGIYLVATAYSTEPARERGRSAVWNSLRLACAGLGTGLLVPAVISLRASGLIVDDPHYFWASFCFGAGLLGGGLALRWAMQWRHARWLQRHREKLFAQPTVGQEGDPLRLRASVEEAVRRGAQWYGVTGVLLMGVAALSLDRKLGLWLGLELLWIGVTSLLLTRGDGLSSPWSTSAKGEPLKFRPRPRLILGTKAVLSVLVAIQLVQPVVLAISANLDGRVLISSRSLAALLFPWLGEHLTVPVQSHEIWTREQQLYWLLTMATLTLVISFIEYEWILRPFVRFREDRTVDPLQEPAPWDDWVDDRHDGRGRDVLHRRHAQLTTLWRAYRTWLPVLTVSVNLGFDKLGHRQVVQAMLAGLRQRYHRTFLAWNSAFANFGRLVGAVVLLALASRASEHVPRALDTVACESTAWCKWLLLDVTEFAVPDQSWQTAPDEARGRLLLLDFLPQPPAGERPTKTASGDMPREREEAVEKTRRASDKAVRPSAAAATPAVAPTSPLGPPPAPPPPAVAPAPTPTPLRGAAAPPVSTAAPSPRSAPAPATPAPSPAVPPRAAQPTPPAATAPSPAAPLVPTTTTVASPGSAARIVSYRVADVLLLLLVLFIGFKMLRLVPVFPYRQNLRRIDDLLDSLSARTKTTFGSAEWGPARWIHSMVFADDRIRETEREPVDPRTVELAFLNILMEIQKGGFRFPGAARDHLSLPAPEITFVFDELDKLGTRVDPDDLSIEPGVEEREIAVIHNERERTRRLRSLLSDLKNVLSSAPARFIFVGGRDLHDEWLADQTSRQPLLTSIFNTEVYLPSLMLDHDEVPHGRRRPRPDPAPTRSLEARIHDYLISQHRRAEFLHARSARKRMRPFFALSSETIALETFASQPRRRLPPLVDRTSGKPLADPLAGRALVVDFVRFLTHRSMGNPKRLKDLLASFVRSTGRELALLPAAENRWSYAACRHVLKFGDTEIFRIQLLATIYRHLTVAFEERMLERDDKLAVSILFLTDFIFKFHSRAFSWGNLERVDDLAHIHRLPDLRDIQEEIVDHFSERFLHRVLNGMYAFRFRSDVACEVEYLSRKSHTEMAAFNFTLDESQALKATYQSALKREENADLLAGLGELYEFDHEFERARHYYAKAIGLLDRQLLEQAARQKRVVEGDDEQQLRAISAILAGNQVGMETARLFLTWGEARLRLMLLIGMTYEQVRDLERAEMQYRSARTLARSLVKACAAAEQEDGGDDHLAASNWLVMPPGMASPLAVDRKRGGDGGRLRWGRLHTLKHMNVVFQPMFASAWLAEKAIGSIDTSISLVEKQLLELREKLPFVGKPKAEESRELARPSHRNFALTLSQLHNRAADLYFFKGRQPVLPTALAETAEEAARTRPSVDRRTDGYLLRAHYHYAVAVHDLRRFLWHRVESSRHVLTLADRGRSGAGDAVRTLSDEAWPDFVFRAAGGTVNDMAEATLARISLFGLFRSVVETAAEGGPTLFGGDPPDYLNRQEKTCTEWLTKGDSDDLVKPPAPSNVETDQPVETRPDERRLSNWFGAWEAAELGGKRREVREGVRLVTFGKPDSEIQRLEASLALCVTGSRYLERGGYPEDAAREHLQVAETVCRYLWWARFLARLHEVALRGENAPAESGFLATVQAWAQDGNRRSLLEAPVYSHDRAKSFWQALTGVAVQALTDAGRLFHQSRFKPGAACEGGYLVGEVVPPEALTLLCSLGLAAGGRFSIPGCAKLLQEWTGPTAGPDWRQVLKKAIKRHRYPMINRLNAIKLLVDHQLVTDRDRKALPRLTAWTEELLNLNAQFDAPLHFTPLHSGTTCALLWLQLRLHQKTGEEPSPALERIYRAAEHDLRVSEEMYTMRRAYHEAISDLYYLYDDFNDRQIHFNHAIQMAGAELTSLLRSLLELEPLGGRVRWANAAEGQPAAQAGQEDQSPPVVT